MKGVGFDPDDLVLRCGAHRVLMPEPLVGRWEHLMELRDCFCREGVGKRIASLLRGGVRSSRCGSRPSSSTSWMPTCEDVLGWEKVKSTLAWRLLHHTGISLPDLPSKPTYVYFALSLTKA